MEACFRYVLIYGASVFLSHSGTVANDQTIWECKKRGVNCSLVTYTYVLPIYYPSPPSEVDSLNWLINTQYWKVEKHERGMNFKNK